MTEGKEDYGGGGFCLSCSRSRCSICCIMALRPNKYLSSCAVIWRGTTRNWFLVISGKEIGPRAGIRCVPHWNIRPAFQKTKQARKIDAAASAARGDRKMRVKRSRKTPNPRIKSGVSETKKRLPYEEMPAQSG